MRTPGALASHRREGKLLAYFLFPVTQRFFFRLFRPTQMHPNGTSISSVPRVRRSSWSFGMHG